MEWKKEDMITKDISADIYDYLALNTVWVMEVKTIIEEYEDPILTFLRKLVGKPPLIQKYKNYTLYAKPFNSELSVGSKPTDKKERYA